MTTNKINNNTALVSCRGELGSLPELIKKIRPSLAD